jgi:hypothetical protein
MVERRIELDRRYHRKKKMKKLKARLAAAKDDKVREATLQKIKRLSPFWTEPGTAKPTKKAEPKAKTKKA